MNRPVPSLKARAVALLARREHSRSDLRRKLLAVARAEDEAGEGDAAAIEREIDALLDLLAAQGLLSEQRFIDSRLHARAPRLGTRRIEHELAQHGVELDEARRQALRATEADRARAAWKRKFGEVATDASERARQARFLAARGFSAAVIAQVVRGLVDPPGDDD